jgi:hypothetical protein
MRVDPDLATARAFVTDYGDSAITECLARAAYCESIGELERAGRWRRLQTLIAELKLGLKPA